MRKHWTPEMVAAWGRENRHLRSVPHRKVRAGENELNPETWPQPSDETPIENQPLVDNDQDEDAFILANMPEKGKK